MMVGFISKAVNVAFPLAGEKVAVLFTPTMFPDEFVKIPDIASVTAGLTPAPVQLNVRFPVEPKIICGVEYSWMVPATVPLWLRGIKALPVEPVWDMANDDVPFDPATKDDPIFHVSTVDVVPFQKFASNASRGDPLVDVEVAAVVFTRTKSVLAATSAMLRELTVAVVA